MAQKTIFLDGCYEQVEHDAGATRLTPGMLVKVNSSNQVVVHDSEGGDCEVLVVREDSYQGSIVSTAYTSGDPVFCGIPRPGCNFQGLLKAGQDVDIGDLLISSGDGTWKALTDCDSSVATPKVLAVAMEAEDLSDSGAANTLVKMRRV